MKSSTSKGTETREFNYREIDWELRPGGMLVQKRDVGVGSSGPMIKIKVSHGSCHYDTDVPAQSTFGDLKKVLANETGLEPKEQRLLFRGKERENDEYLHMVGVKDMSKVILFEDPASKERKLEEMKRNQGTFEAYEAVARVRAEVDKLCEKVRRIQSFVDTLDNLKVRNSNPFSNSSSAVSVTTKWETFASGVGSLSAPVPIQSATKVTQDWELFD
ncbi:BAG family molecular chaperone regulator 4-like isoform X3 [Populus nigra]|uniref:BAG family molecular chaperone regulator 4-like isoform X3 n=1 Tax=Populus nigra TaxID=3691 RepID=UPI002B266BCC|nr:BAG family molecular chaperone regulator 4-like isoform X3 [Populus nigra]